MYPRGNPQERTNRGGQTQPPQLQKVKNDYPRSMLNPGPRTSSTQASESSRRRKQEADKLIADCYSKIIGDSNGRRYHEVTYQTHLSVTEFSSFPSHPPPDNTPTSQLGSIKNRVLVVCVKHSGRLMIQKGKFNADKNIFQIGRTWDMDELHTVTRNGNNGILLSLNKDYYWRVEEGTERIWKFARFLTSAYGNFMKKYPSLKGFSIEDFKLPPILDKRTMGPNQTSSNSFSDATISSKTPMNIPLMQKTTDVNADDIYKGFDFTSNGKLPVKPMIIMDRAGSGSNSQASESHNSNNQSIDIESIANNDDAGSFVFKTKQSHSSQKLHEYVQSNENLEASPLRNYKPTRTSQEEYQAQPRQVSESLESVAAIGVKLEEQLDSKDEVISRKNTLSRENTSLRSSSRTNPSFKKEISPDFGIEEVSDDSESGETKPIPETESLSDVIDESTKLDAGKIDTSIQELENYMDSYLKGSQQRKASLKPSTNKEDTKPTNEEHRIPKMEKGNPIEQGGGYALEEDEEIFTTKKNKIAPEKNESLSVDFETEKDPEIEDLLEEINWTIFDSSEQLIKKLSKELNTIKQKNVSQLIELDFSNVSVSNDFKASVKEVENLTNIFKQMELEFKLLTPEINQIENNSQGLQVKSINEKALYKDLKGILDKVVINTNDLKVIETFDEFESLNKLSVLESQLSHLYNALTTVGHEYSDEKDDLSSMKALKQYQEYYEHVSLRFITNFSTFIKHEIDFIIKQAAENIGSFHPNSIFRLLNNVLIYSSITYFIKDIFSSEFQSLKSFITNRLSSFLEQFIHSKIESIRSTSSDSPSIGHNLSRSLEGHSLKKSRTLRFSKKDKLRGKLGLGESEQKSKEHDATSNSLLQSNDDMKSIISIIEDSEQLICIVQYFLGNFFHYDTSILNFNEYLAAFTFRDRYALLEIPSFGQINGKSYTNELILSMNMVFGSYITFFLKNIVPSESSIPALLVHLENEFEEHKGNNEEFLVFNFLSKTIERYKNLWSKYISTQIDYLNKSTVVAKCGILPAVKNINHLVMLTESSLEGINNSKNAHVRVLLDTSYKDITEAAIHLFMRDDPLLKSHDFDDKEREHRNVSIVQNIFYLSDQLSVFELESVKKMTSQLESVLKKAQDSYFEKLLSKHIGKLIEFVNNYETLSKMNRAPKEYNKKYVKSLVSSYTAKEISIKSNEIFKKLEKHYISGNDMFEKDLLEKLWLDMENQFIFYFVKLDQIIKTKFDMDIDYHITKQDIHSIFTSIH